MILCFHGRQSQLDEFRQAWGWYRRFVQSNQRLPQMGRLFGDALVLDFRVITQELHLLNELDQFVKFANGAAHFVRRQRFQPKRLPNAVPRSCRIVSS